MTTFVSWCYAFSYITPYPLTWDVNYCARTQFSHVQFNYALPSARGNIWSFSKRSLIALFMVIILSTIIIPHSRSFFEYFSWLNFSFCRSHFSYTHSWMPGWHDLWEIFPVVISSSYFEIFFRNIFFYYAMWNWRSCHDQKNHGKWHLSNLRIFWKGKLVDLIWSSSWKE